MRSSAIVVAAVLVTLTAQRSSAQTPPPAPLEADNPAPLPAPAHLEAPPDELAEPPARAARPRLSAAVGMGASFESTGLSPARTELVPAFFATGGVGADWPAGFELAAFASSAFGRFKAPDAPVDRLALAALGVVRPLAWKLRLDDARYGARVLRTLGVELGLGVERDGTTVRSGSRVGVHAGARLELPLSREPASKELRLRLAVRRLQGLYTPRVGAVDVGNGVEIYLALVSVF